MGRSMGHDHDDPHEAALEGARTRPLEELAQTTPLIELAQAMHDRLYSRLFQS